MVTISTPEELLRALRENPEWKETVRREILTEELLNLPARFDRFAASTEHFIAEQRQFNQDTEQAVSDLRQFNDEQRQFNDEHRGFNQQVVGFMDRTNARFARIEDDISNMRGAYARTNALGEAEDIAEDMGFQIVRSLTRDDMRELLRTSDTTGIAVSQQRSFREADLVIEAIDQNGATHYIAVEISNQADERDTHHAARNAEFLTPFTGKPAHAAIASVRNDLRIQSAIDSCQIYWHALVNRDAHTE